MEAREYTKINAKIIADSKNQFGNRITTMQVTFPRIILAELNTHRMLSKNSASSRAIPFKKMIESVKNDPFIPIAFQKDHSGMQGTEYFEGIEATRRKNKWLDARWKTMVDAIDFHEMGVTKQLANRMLEPFMWHTVIITATEWENFFALRCPKYSIFNENMPMEFRSKKDLIKFAKQVEAPEFKNQYDNLTNLEWLKCNKGQAEIHMMELAEQMWDAMNESTPKELKTGEWHIPFGDNVDDDYIGAILSKDSDGSFGQSDFDKIKIEIATARCARVSYTVVGEEDKPHNYEADIKLYDRLREDDYAGHMSPFEHCAQAVAWDDTEFAELNKKGELWSGNFRGFVQYRKMLPNENIVKNG